MYDPSFEKDSCGVALICNIKKKKEHKIIQDALISLGRMEHRGATGEEELTGDGVGIITGLPNDFYIQECSKLFDVSLKENQYSTGLIFFPKDQNKVASLKKDFLTVLSQFENEITFVGWRTVPIDKEVILGKTSKFGEPHIEQIFLKTSEKNQKKFEANLYFLKSKLTLVCPDIYVSSLSSQTIVYKGQLTCNQFVDYFEDLKNPEFKTHVAIVHSRFSTNTFPSWMRAQPNSLTSHNGEINTVKGNSNWMKSREGIFKNTEFGKKLTYPIIPEGLSDSGAFNAVLELLVAAGRTLPEALTLMIPEAWQNDSQMDESKKQFYRYHSALLEAWDGPACFLFTDSNFAGALLDRNGLRPSRYYITNDDRIIMGSEVGILDIDSSLILKKGRLEPGKIFLIDFEKCQIIDDSTFKNQISLKNPYSQWLENQSVNFSHLNLKNSKIPTENEFELKNDPLLKVFNYTVEHIELLLVPMGLNGSESLGSMGNDETLAVLGKTPRLIFDYFKQLFAQVTNPPIDPFRESIVMSLSTFIGPEGNILETTEKQARRLELEFPILTQQELEGIINMSYKDMTCKTIDITYNVQLGENGVEKTIQKICNESEKAVEDGFSFIVLSDKSVNFENVPVPSLLASGAVHHRLVSKGLRSKVGIIVESGDVREVHHFCLLFGFGADAVCPYMVYNIFSKLLKENEIQNTEKNENSLENLIEKYHKSCKKGIMKVLAKMGISTLQSYKGAQAFEAIGLNTNVTDLCFTGVSNRIKGVNFEFFGKSGLYLHKLGFPNTQNLTRPSQLLNWGNFHWRDEKSQHAHSPESIAKLQEATKMERSEARESFKEFSKIADQQTQKCMLRGLLKFKTTEKSISVDEVEPASEIVKRFVTGAMSYGSISLETHETLALAMNQLGGKSNTGEGGEDSDRFFDEKGNLGSKRSSIKQVASGRFGVSSFYLANSDELQIKMAQGAKPGEGGELPGYKVNQSIAKTRNSTAGVCLISPPPHHDIYSIEDLKQLIHDLKNSNPTARISVKLVSEIGVGVIAAGVCKAKADHILISGHDGGTGASSWTGIKHAGLPWELGLSETHQTLVKNGLRGKVTLQTDGGFRTGKDVIYASLLGAEEFGFGTVPLITLGCIMMRKCHLNTCPVGIATQDPELRKKFAGQPEHLINYFFLVAEEVREYMATLGFKNMNEMIGRADLLEHTHFSVPNNQVDLSPLLISSEEIRSDAKFFCSEKQDHKLNLALDNELIEKCSNALDPKNPKPVALDLIIKNTNRTVGTLLSYQVSKIFGEKGLPDNTINIKLRGTAGQSIGAFLAPGITLELIGDSNDYVGKGLSGGKLIVYPPEKSSFKSHKSVIIGNVALFGATLGEAYISGVAAERFCVRNSGCTAVVEGVGDHGCEYMTDGRVIIVGETGKNFAAGMSGGIAYVLDKFDKLKSKTNLELVSFEELQIEDENFIKDYLCKHVQFTKSKKGSKILANWSNFVGMWKKILPNDYKRVLEEQKQVETQKNTIDSKSTSRKKKIIKHEPNLQIKQNCENAEIDIEDTIPIGKQAKIHGFENYKRKTEPYRKPEVRRQDFDEIFDYQTEEEKTKQASRCMDCGVPFCQSNTGCPISNLIPEFNELVYQGKWKLAYERLMLTNNFPEFTGRVCPAPCEGSCTLGINQEAVTIKNIENSIINKAWENGWVVPNPPENRSGFKVCIIGSGPAGLSAADQLNKLGHGVTVYERSDQIGGLLMYGIPNMKLSKEVVQRRIQFLQDEGIVFKTNSEIGKNVPVDKIMEQHDAVLLAVGSTVPRNLNVPGRDFKGVHFAMDYLTAATKSLKNPKYENPFNLEGKKVIVIGGGDTGNDCLGTSIRLKCSSLLNFELLPKPENERQNGNPWPQWPKIMRIDYGHSEAREKFGYDPRIYKILTKQFIGDKNGNLKGLKTVLVNWKKEGNGFKMSEVEGSEKIYECDYCFLSMGFLGPEQSLAEKLNISTTKMSNFEAPYGSFDTNVKKVFAAGDCRRGQSLVVWAINEGRAAAQKIDSFLQDQHENFIDTGSD